MVRFGGRLLDLAWRQVVWPNPLSAKAALSAVTALATDPTGSRLVLEARGSDGAVRFLLGAQPSDVKRLAQLLHVATAAVASTRRPVLAARRLGLSTRLRPLATDHLEASATAILAALAAATRPDEELVIQVLLGNRLPAMVVPSSVARPARLRELLLGPTGMELDGEAKTALAHKVTQPGFHADVRLGVNGGTPARRRELALGLLGAWRRVETPGLRVGVDWLAPTRLGESHAVKWPWWLRLRLNTAEVVAVSGLPVTDPKEEASLPGLPVAHPHPLPPNRRLAQPSRNRIIVAQVSAPGASGWLTRSTTALLHHTQIIGPTGTGKSVLLLNLALQDMAAGRGLIVLEPKGDLVTGLLARVPDHRRADVVVLDPLAERVIGLNPLAPQVAGGVLSELRADQVLSIFTGLFGDALGPRTTDILHASLLTLARRADASLVQIPQLLTNPAFRAPRVAAVAGDVALGPFWAWYQGLRDSERAGVIAPLMNKLRTVLLRPPIRRVLGQVAPRFSVSQVFTGHKILFVPLPVARLGSAGAKLLGSLVTAQIWDAARARTSLPVQQRPPVSIVVDEAQTFLDFQGDIADALATSRSYGVGWTLAHQYLAQLPPPLREAVLTNCRSRVVFQTGQADAKIFAAQTNGPGRLDVEDFTSLPAFHAYISLFDQGQTQPYVSGRTLPPPPASSDPKQLRQASAARYGRLAADIEADFTSDRSQNSAEPGTGPGKERAAGAAPAEAMPVGRRPRHRPISAAMAASGRPSGRDQAAQPNAAYQRPEKPKPEDETAASAAAESSPGEAGGRS